MLFPTYSTSGEVVGEIKTAYKAMCNVHLVLHASCVYTTGLSQQTCVWRRDILMYYVADYRLVWVRLKMRRILSLLPLLNDRRLPQWRQHQLSLRGYILPLNTPPLLHSKCLNVSNIHVRSRGSQAAIETSRNELYRKVDPCFQYIMLLLLYPGRLLLSFACIGVTSRGTLDNFKALVCFNLDLRKMSVYQRV